MSKSLLAALAAVLMPAFSLAHAGGSTARHGGIYGAGLSGMGSHHDVMEILRAELFQRGWTRQCVRDVDIDLRDEGKLVRKRVLQVSHCELVAELMADHPDATLGVSQQNEVYQPGPEGFLSYGDKVGEIKVPVADPGVALKAGGLDTPEAATTMVGDSKAVLDATVALFSKTVE